MKFEKALYHGKLIKRYKRFFADIELDSGEIIVAHCANTGSMKGLLGDDFGAWVTHVNDPKRKLQYTLEMVDTGTSLVGVNTSRPNHIVADGIANGEVSKLHGYANLRKEVKYGMEGKSRIDILLEDENKGLCYVEVKNTTLRVDDAAAFPDAVTTRGAKHLDELINEVQNGNRAVMFYLVQRTDCKYFTPADDIDEVYGAKLREALDAGVEAIVYSCKMSPDGIELDRELEIKL